MAQPALWYALSLPFSILIFSMEFTKANLVQNQVANLSTSWINTPSTAINSTQFPGKARLLPILLRHSIALAFFCGFYCPNDDESCVFGVLVSPSLPGLIYEPELVWSANGDRPVKMNATLRLTQSGDMTLADADGTLVWSTNTGGKSVSGLNLTQDGNLVLYDTSNAAVWQSFDHPTDCLLPGQTMQPGQKLTSSQGLYSLVVQPDGFVAYIESNPRRPYYMSDHTTFKQFIRDMTSISIISETAAHYTKLDPNGHLQIHSRRGLDDSSTMVTDLLANTIGECGYPMVCGSYGVCSKGQCGCLDDANGGSTSLFKQFDYRQPNLGCSLTSPISCKDSETHSLLHLKNMTYFAVNAYLYGSRTDFGEATDLNNCKNKCLTNCSCQATVFVPSDPEGSSTRGRCVLLTEVLSLISSNEDWVGYIQLFVKVQKTDPSTIISRKENTKSMSQRTQILGSTIGGFFFICCAIAFCCFVSRKKANSEEYEDFSIDEIAGMPTRFTYKDLKAATSNFSDKLGEGGFGSVFRGTLTDGTEVAVKLLDGIGHMKKSFLAEIKTIGNTQHVNLVRLIGFCADKSRWLLVYEYMPNGSIDKWIFHKQRDQTLEWRSRRKIILDIAKGLAYLHDDCRNKIIHLDIKPQNILLDKDFTAKVADFGLSKLIDKDQSKVVTTLRGTPGYMAPEWLSSFITEKVDVYSFGVVVLEILCGRQNLDRSQAEEDMHLLSLFQRKAEEDRLIEIVDTKSTDMQLNKEEVLGMTKLAAWCLQTDFSRRPAMSMVVKVLEGLEDAEENLVYSFANIAMPRTTVAEGQNHMPNGETQLLPVSLSGPR